MQSDAAHTTHQHHCSSTNCLPFALTMQSDAAHTTHQHHCSSTNCRYTTGAATEADPRGLRMFASTEKPLQPSPEAAVTPPALLLKRILGVCVCLRARKNLYSRRPKQYHYPHPSIYIQLIQLLCSRVRNGDE
ncbi:hypothetical protein QE152_g37591 [Popillia japonica]|uniref:Uncharacterized protein n=1 Tax=Popillia japonica TaxID=7064 RepID=A0AAW1IA44_POPJA